MTRWIRGWSIATKLFVLQLVMVPSRMRSVTTAHAASTAQGSVAQMPSQTKNASHPDASARGASSTASSGSVPVKMKPCRMRATLPTTSDRGDPSLVRARALRWVR